MKSKTMVALVVMSACLAGTGCGKPPPPMPVTLGDYQRLRSESPQDYPPGSVLTRNLTRVLDTGLTEEERLTSMELVAALQPRGRTELEALGAVQYETGNPRLKGMVRDYLARVPSLPAQPNVAYVDRSAYPPVQPRVDRSAEPRLTNPQLGSLDEPRVSDGGTPEVTPRIPTAPVPYDVRSQRLRELLTRGRADDLSEVVVYWAQEPAPPDEKVDAGYRGVVEKLTGKVWDEALLDALNQPRFAARGSAVEVLAARIDQASLAGRVAAVAAPASEALQVMKVFATYFGYVPQTRQELLSTVRVYKAYGGRVEEPAKLARQWLAESQGLDDDRGVRGQSRYRFNIRDFHILAGLAQDPGNSRTDRLSLVTELAKSLPTRRVMRPGTGVDDSLLSAAVSKMNRADLWNVWLMNEMLASAEFRGDLRLAAERDLNDVRSAWGGLMVYNPTAKRTEVRTADAVRGGVSDDVRYLP
ncbi:MAG: hypothetical protein NT031_12660, partial [Planctomycetota bacterium]|nr:hypothetical protein [Planctomycetota bacterium]